MESSIPPLVPHRHDLSNLRTFLIIFVTIHHTAIAYGGDGNWPFKSTCFTRDSSPLLISFGAVGQSCGMGLFFWISGRLSATSLSRNTIPSYFRRKFLRLGLPTLVYTLFVNPLVYARTLPNWNSETVWRGLLGYWIDLRGVRGVVWYTALLLTFDIISASSVSICHSRHIVLESPSPSPTEKLELVYKLLSTWGWLLVAALSFILRLWYPVGTTVDPLAIQPAYVSQYIFAYTLGFLSFHLHQPRFTGPFDRPPRSNHSTPSPSTSTETEIDADTSKPAPIPALRFRLALSISFLTLPLIVLLPLLVARLTGQTLDLKSQPTRGGFNLSAACYALWNEFSFVLLGPSIMYHFQARYNTPAKSWVWQPRYSYAAYLAHPLLNVVVEVVVDAIFCRDGKGVCAGGGPWWRVFVGPVVFTAGVGWINAALAFVVGRGLVEYVPGMRRVL